MPLIQVGAKAPSFEMSDQGQKRHALSDYAGRPVVLYFYPKDDTSGCTDQACQFRDQAPDFSGVNAVVLGVSPDDEKSHAKFAAKNDLNFTLLADTQRNAAGDPKVCDAYGVWGEKSMYGKAYMGVTRTTYLIDGEGVVRRRWDNVSVPGHAAEVLAAVKDLAAGRGAGESGGAKTTRATGKKAEAGLGPLLSMAQGKQGVLKSSQSGKPTRGLGGPGTGGARPPSSASKSGVPRRPGGKRGG